MKMTEEQDQDVEESEEEEESETDHIDNYPEAKEKNDVADWVKKETNIHTWL